MPSFGIVARNTLPFITAERYATERPQHFLTYNRRKERMRVKPSYSKFWSRFFKSESPKASRKKILSELYRHNDVEESFVVFFVVVDG